MAVQWTVDTAFDLWQISHELPVLKQDATTKCWHPPPAGWHKCNVDGAFYPRDGQGAFGAVLRSSSGDFIEGRARWYPYGLDALTMVALACRDGMEIGRD